MKSGRQKGGQDVSQGVDDAMRGILRAGAKMEDGKKLRTGIDGQPEPQHVVRAAQSGSQFVQLEMREVEVTKGALVQDLCMLPSACEPRGDGGLSVAKDPFGSGKV